MCPKLIYYNHKCNNRCLIIYSCHPQAQTLRTFYFSIKYYMMKSLVIDPVSYCRPKITHAEKQ